MPDKVITTEFRPIDRLTAAFNNMGNGARNFGNRANNAFNKASGAGIRFGDVIKGILGAQILRRGFQLLKEGLGNFIEQASMIEDATAKFTPLMGGVERATELVDALNKTAATTPHTFEEISKVASQLLPVMDGNIENTIATFRMLGDTAGGNAQKLDSITRGYTKAMLKGKVDMEALNMIAEAGVPIFSEMAKSMGISQEQLFELSKQGKLTTDDLTKTFQTMTSEGGIFFQGMEIASQTFSGKMSTLKDNINLTFAALGSAALPIIKDFIDLGIEVAGSIREWATANKELIQTKITEFVNTLKMIFDKLAPPITAVWNAIIKLGTVIFDLAMSIIPGFVKENATLENGLDALTFVLNLAAGFIDAVAAGIKFLSPVLTPLLTALVAWAAYQWAVNVAMSANPIGLIITGIAALVAAISWLSENWDAVVEKFPLVQNLADFFTAAAGVIVGVFQGVFDFIIGVIDFVKSAVDQITGQSYNQKMLDMAVQRGMPEEEARQMGWNGGSEQEAPNRQEVEAQQLNIQGRLDIFGAPEGSTVEQKNSGGLGKFFNLEQLGVNP